jgi:uncharacterized OB-fold protein
MFCAACGHAEAPYPSPLACPKCGSTTEWKDDHAALADYGDDLAEHAGAPVEA